jgi:hypothetical protein
VGLYILFFLYVGSRRAFVSGITAHPDAAWVTQHGRGGAGTAPGSRAPGSLKRELVHRESFTTREQARAGVFEYMAAATENISR